MSDDEILHAPLILHDCVLVADLGIRIEAEGDRQDAMVSHNERTSLELTYTFRANVRASVTEGAKLAPTYTFRAKLPAVPTEGKELASLPDTASEPRIVGRPEVEATLPSIEYRTRCRTHSEGGVDDAVVILMTTHEIVGSLEPDFKAAVTACAETFKLQTSKSLRPDRPERDYRPGEGILNYLRSPQGFGPWIAAGSGVLTRPLIREKAPRAYTALANWLRSNTLPDDLPIPTKSQVLDAEVPRSMSLREARRIARRGDRRRGAGGD